MADVLPARRLTSCNKRRPARRLTNRQGNHAMTYTPTTRAEFENLFNEYSSLCRRLERADNIAAEAAASMAAKHQQDTAADRCKKQEMETAISDYAWQHRNELTENGKSKTAKIGTGCLKWRKAPAAVQITGDIEAILEQLRRRKLSRLIRVKQEIDKTALLAERELISRRPIDGIEIADGAETLSITP